jgi:DNA repair exonuclease SbcCD ATPase subunit
MPVEPNSDYCASCGAVFKRVLDAQDCPSCETLISDKASVCPICNVKIKEFKVEKKESAGPIEMDQNDRAFLSKLMDWTAGKKSLPETKEDKEEREQALKVFKSITPSEPEEHIEERLQEIKGAPADKEEIQKLEKQMMSLGKPFESILERNLMNITLVDKELDEKNSQLDRMEREKGKFTDSMRAKLKDEIEDLEKKRSAMKVYESNIMMLGGAFRKVLGHQQGELYKWENDLKKRVSAFQKEVEMRRKQKESLKKKEDALDKREEELSHRFLDLKSRENELKVREDMLKKRIKDLEKREEELKAWESEFEASREIESPIAQAEGTKGEFSKEEWLKQQRRFQADMINMTGTAYKAGNMMPGSEMIEAGFKNEEEGLKKREEEMETIKQKMEDLNRIIIEKDREIESLKGGAQGFTMDEETREILRILDDLLENLPDNIVDQFARSDKYLLYERVLEKYKL